MPRPMTPMQTSTVAASWPTASPPMPLVMSVSTATSAPEELQIGLEMLSSI